MIKRTVIALIVALFAALLSLGAFATADGEIYDNFDDYYEFADEEEASRVITQQRKVRPWYYRLSPIPVVIGIAAGVATVAMLYKKTESVEDQSRVRRKPTFSCETLSERDIK